MYLSVNTYMEQRNKPVLMIHEMRHQFFTLPLENYTLTFDDGLYSQYYYWPQLREIPTEKIFFISSGIVCGNERQSLGFPNSRVAHQKAFDGIFEDYMTVEQIRELMADPLTSVGGHGHNHTHLSKIKQKTGKIQYLLKDTDQMIQWFEQNLGSAPTKFCFPYNDDLDGMYQAVLRQRGIKEFYGRERIPIEKLQQSSNQSVAHDSAPM